LSCTWDKGTIVKPTNTLQLDCYVNADFAGLYKCDPDASPTSAKSHLGLIISRVGVPLVAVALTASVRNFPLYS
jgi:hypothetical protein